MGVKFGEHHDGIKITTFEFDINSMTIRIVAEQGTKVQVVCFSVNALETAGVINLKPLETILNDK